MSWFKDREKVVYDACKTLLTTCSNCKKDENILTVTDDESMDIGLALWDAAEEFPNRTLTLMNARYMHGEEPPDTVAAAMFTEQNLVLARLQSKGYLDSVLYMEQSNETTRKISALKADKRRLCEREDDDRVIKDIQSLIA